MDLSKSVIRLHHSLVCGNDSILHLTIVFKATKTEKVETLFHKRVILWKNSLVSA